MDGAVAVSGVGSCRILTTVAAGDLELHTTQRLSGNAVHLGNEQRTIVIEDLLMEWKQSQEGSDSDDGEV